MSDQPLDVTTALDGLGRLCRTAILTGSARMAFLAARDREHAITLVEDVAQAVGAPAHHVTPSGVSRLDADEGGWTSVLRKDLTPCQMLNEARARGGLVIVEQFIAQLREPGPQVQARVQLAELLATQDIGGHGLVLVCLEAPEDERHLPPLIAGQVVRFAIGYPRAEELQAVARAELAYVSHLAGKPRPAADIREQAVPLGEGLVGLTRKAARDLLRDSLADNLDDLARAHEFLTRNKTERLRRELAMEVLEPGGEAEVPLGLENLLEFISILNPQMRITGKGRARGVLLVGPPGTGKTMLARAVGRLTQLPVCVLKIGALMNSLLGETERRFAEAFATLEAMAPAIVFIDEIEKAFGDSSERDGGTMMRVTGGLLSWLSDNQQPNFVIATSNGIARMGEIGLTMVRSGRFDEIFFVDNPAAAARAAIWVQALGEGWASQIEALATDTDMFSGADIDAVVKLARARAQHEGQSLSLRHLQFEIARKRPRAEAMFHQFNALRQWGEANAIPAARPA